MGEDESTINKTEGDNNSGNTPPAGAPIPVLTPEQEFMLKLEETERLGFDFLDDKNIPKVIPETMAAKILSVDKVLFDRTVKSAIIPTPLGDIAVLPGHTPLYILLVTGKITLELPSGSQKEIEVESGLARITQSEIKILAGFAVEEAEKKK